MKGSVIGSVGSILLALIGFIIILYLAYAATKRVGKRMSLKGVGGKNIKILESVSIGQNNAILIIQAAGKNLLVGVTQQGINLICEIDGDKLDLEEESKGLTGGMEFSKAFKKALEQKFGRKTAENKEKENDDAKEEQ